MAITPAERASDLPSSTDWLREMQREAMRPDGLDRLVRMLSRRASGAVALLDRSGAVMHAYPVLPQLALGEAASAIARVVRGDVHVASAEIDAGFVHVQSIGPKAQHVLLLVVRNEALSPPVLGLLGDAARLLWLRWRVEDLSRRQEQVSEAEAHLREAVLHLLMIGDVHGARRSAAALGPSLADQIRVYVIECPAGARDESIAECDRAFTGRAWIVPCPVYTRHIIVLAPSSPGGDGMEDTVREYASSSRGIAVGSSETLTLPQVATGYEQAFHALAVARGSSEHYATFGPRGDLAALLRPRAQGWARAALQALSSYRAGRGQDPGADELIATLRSWLDFYSGAARQLKIHRNTLTARLRRIEQLLGSNLNDIDAQSRLYLALRILDGPGGGSDERSLDALLDSPEVRVWAARQLSPLLQRDPDVILRTLRVWLENNASVEATASALGISVPGVRKRLTRIEGYLQRSLLSGPSGRYDMWFALRSCGAGATSLVAISGACPRRAR